MLRQHDILTAAHIRDALRACFCPAPGPPRNIVDMGLVESIDVAPDQYAPGAGISGVPPRQSLTLRLIAPSADEDANAILLAQVHNRLRGLPQLSHIQAAWVIRNPQPPAFAILNNRKRGAR